MPQASPTNVSRPSVVALVASSVIATRRWGSTSVLSPSKRVLSATQNTLTPTSRRTCRAPSASVRSSATHVPSSGGRLTRQRAGGIQVGTFVDPHTEPFDQLTAEPAGHQRQHDRHDFQDQ